MEKGKFIYHSCMMESDLHLKRNDLIEIVDINLAYLARLDYNKIKKSNERDLKWLLYIFVCSDEKIRRKLYEKNPLMKKVKGKMEEVSSFLDEMLYYDSEHLRTVGAFEDGKEKGKEEGKKEQQILIAKKLIQEKMDFVFISKVTELPIGEIKQIEKDLTE